MIINLSKQWLGKAALVQRKNDFVIVHTYKEGYNIFTEVLDSDERAVVKKWTPLEFYSSDMFDKLCKKFEYILRDTHKDIVRKEKKSININTLTSSSNNNK